MITVKKFRLALAKFRTSSGRLEVEMGWWARPENTALENRKCKHCQTLEDEYRFILICPLYPNIRTLYIKKYYYTKPNMFKLTELMFSKSKIQIRYSATFVNKAFEERNRILYTDSDWHVFNSRHCGGQCKLSVFTVIIVEICIDLSHYFYIHFHICITTPFAMLIHVYIVNTWHKGQNGLLLFE